MTHPRLSIRHAVPLITLITALLVTVLQPCALAGETTYKTVENIPYRVDPAATEDMRTNCLLDLYYPENVKDCLLYTSPSPRD